MPYPGEISLFHRDVLFHNDVRQVSHWVLEATRQRVENKVVALTRTTGTLTSPANSMLVAAMTAYPCGYSTDQVNEFTCPPTMIAR